MSCVHDEAQIERWTAELLGRGAGRWEVLPPASHAPESWSPLRTAVVILVGAGLVVVVVVLGVPIVMLVMDVIHFAL